MVHLSVPVVPVHPGSGSPRKHADEEAEDLVHLEIVGRSLLRPPTEIPVDEDLAGLGRTRDESLVLGVSVAFLTTEFLKEVEDHFGAGADPDYHEINPVMLCGPLSRGGAFLCPRDGMPGCSYVDALDARHTGQATVMLSWCWRYRVQTVVGALGRWCHRTGRDPARTFVWQCALCCNQFRIEDKKACGESEPFEVFEEAFESRVQATMHVLALLDPWDEPIYISRIWCIFELWKALNTDGCTLEVILPEVEEIRFRNALRSDGLMAMWKAFDKLRIQEAEATVEADRDNILRLVDPDVRDFADYEWSDKCAQVNREVVGRLQAWCVDIGASHAEAQITRRQSEADASGPLGASTVWAGKMLAEMADWPRAEAILSAARQNIEECGSTGSDGHMSLLRHLADLKNKQGQHEEASDLIEQVISSLECPDHLDASPGPALVRHVWSRRSQYGAALRTAGETCNFRGELVQAVELFERSRNAYVVSGQGGSQAHAETLLQLAWCLSRQGRYGEAEEAFTEASGFYDADGSHTPADGELLIVLARCRLGQDRLAEAMELAGRARRILEDTGSTRSASYGGLLTLQGSLQLSRGCYEEAKGLFVEAATVLENIDAVARLEYAILPTFHGKLHLCQGKVEAAMAYFLQAQENLEKAGMDQTPEYGWTLLARGKCHLQLGEGDTAMDFLAQARHACESAGAGGAFDHLVFAGV